MSVPSAPKSTLAAFALGLALVVAGPLASRMAQGVRERGAIAGEEIERRNASAFSQIFGEIRVTLSEFMYVKTERYMDSGVAYLPHISVARLERTGEADAASGAESQSVSAGLDAPPGEEPPAHDDREAGHAGGHGEHEGGVQGESEHPAAHGRAEGEPEPDVPTIIRQPQSDFRGFLGDLEREVKPYRDPSLPHQHTSGEELLPWYRLMTLVNPRNVRAYLIGAMWLNQQGERAEAIAFVKEGIASNKDNPELFRLYVSLATLNAKNRFGGPHGTPLDRDWARKTLEAAEQAWRLGKERRPANGVEGAIKKDLAWRTDLEEEFCFAGRYIPLILLAQGHHDQALSAAREFQSLVPDDIPIKQIVARIERERPAR